MPPVLWTQRQDIGPSARGEHVAVYGPERLVLFGGDAGGTLFNDTWTWDGSLWTQVADTGPSARSGAAIAYDGSSQQTILCGGQSGGTALNDTWRWDGANWTQVADTGPTRAGHAMAFDAARNQIVLFGGGGVSTPLNDTWAWDGVAWRQVQDVGPSPRTRHAMANDPVTQRVVLFGGAMAGGAGLDDTWAWDGVNWVQIADTGPAGRACSAMVADGSGLVLFGGISTIDPAAPVGSQTIFGDTWQWLEGQWTQVQDMGPAPRWLHTLGFDAKTGRVTLFGGATAVTGTGDPDGLLRDTWEHSGTPVAPDDPISGDQILTIVSAQILGGSQPLVMGDSLTIAFELDEPAPAPVGIQTILAVNNNGNWEQLEQPGLSVPGSVVVDSGDTGGQFDITRGPDPLDNSVGYAVALVVDGAPDVGAIVEFQVA